MKPQAQGPKQQVTFSYVTPDQLRFDPVNPRIAGAGANASQDDMQSILEKEPHLALELVPSFLENGFIDYEPLVVRAEREHFVVVEGNRRLAAIKHILSKKADFEGKTTRFADLGRIPVLVFAQSPESQREKEQRVFLGVHHLFGFREWPPESKAKYLDAQIKTAKDVERVTRELNIKRQDLQRYLIPYRLRQQAGPLWKPHRDQDFWVMGESLSRTGIKTYIELDVDRESLRVRRFDKKKLGYLLRFIYGTPTKDRNDRVVKETRQLSSLAKVLQNKKAAGALEQGRPLAEALVLIESVGESHRRLEELVRECRTVLARFRGQSGSTELFKGFRAFRDSVRKFLIHVR